MPLIILPVSLFPKNCIECNAESWEFVRSSTVNFKTPQPSIKAFVVFFKQGQRMSVIHKEPSDPRPDRLHHGRVQVTEVRTERKEGRTDEPLCSTTYSFQTIVLFNLLYEFKIVIILIPLIYI